MSPIGQWRWRRRRNQAFGFWENREGERIGPIPLDGHGRAAFVPSSDCQGAVSALTDVRAYAEALKRSPERRVQRIGADLMGVLASHEWGQ